MIISHNYDEELRKLENLKALANEINAVEIEKLFIGAEEIAKALRCSERRAKEFMRSPGFPVIDIGGKPVVNVFALAEFTKSRIEYADLKRGVK